MCMASVNASRHGMATNVTRAVRKAELIGFNHDGHACVWYGGYSFNVYDAARDWQEISHFTSGDMVDWSNQEKARKRMEKEGFKIIG